MFSFQYTTNTSDAFTTTELKDYLSKLPTYTEQLQSRNQGFIAIHDTDTTVIKEMVEKTKDHFDVICVLGIGGSMLGPQFLYDSLGKYNKHGKQFVFVDNIDPELIESTRRSLPLQRTLFLVQSKSGKTPETIAMYSYFLSEVMKQGLVPEEHFMFVTDPEKGFLREEAHNKGIPVFDLPENIGGRFSVLTPVGLLMAAFADIDIDLLLAGSKYVIDNQLTTLNDASCLTYAGILDHYYKQEISINVLMPYSSRLKLLSNWAVQLISESTGKESNRDEKTVNWGITPLPSLGATDQHSQLQLFAQGPNNKVITFIEVTQKKNIPIEETSMITGKESFEFLKGVSFGQLLDAEFKGTKQSLEERGAPTITLSIDTVNEYSVGMLIQFFQLTIGYLGEITNIDMFNQPGVERSKVLAKENLQS